MKKSKSPLLVVTIDTEEDNWGQHRDNIRCSNITRIPRLQQIFDRFGIVPTYLVSYQVCLDEAAAAILKTIHDAGKCEIGAHLHPWNTPPESESLTAENSFLKNLPYELQLAKLTALTEKIEEIFDITPQSFRTGRWGLGRDTVRALSECGYRVDSSITPTLSWKDDGNGPSYSTVETDPYLLCIDNAATGVRDAILEIPATIGYNRWPFSFYDKIYRLADHPLLRPLHLVGILNRTSLLRKLWLTPEGFSAGMLQELADILIRNNKQLLNLSFHSNTLMPGLTPFVATEEDAQNFLATLETLFTYLGQRTTIESQTLRQAAAGCEDFSCSVESHKVDLN